MQTEKHPEFQASTQDEEESAFALLSQLTHLTDVLWDHYELVFLDKLRERNSSSSDQDPIKLPF